MTRLSAVPFEPLRLSDRVWLWPSDPDPDKVQSTVGIVCGERETILIDAGNGPDLAIGIQRWLQTAGLPPVGHIILTHHHWDHSYGACAFDVPVIAQAECYKVLREDAGKPWSPSFLAAEMARNPRLGPSYRARLLAVKDWERFRIVLPDILVEARESLVLDGIRFELEPVGGQHAKDSMIIRVPHARVAFLGDCYYPPPFHLRTLDSAPDREMLASLVSDACDLYVEGHDLPRSRTQLERWFETDRDAGGYRK